MAHSNFLTFDFEPGRVFQEIEYIDDLERRFNFINDLISIYKEIKPKWRKVLQNHPKGLIREKTEEYAEILRITPDYDKVIETSYNIMNAWPQWVLPKLNTYKTVIKIRHVPDTLSYNYEIFKKEEIESHALDIAYIKREFDKIQNLEERLYKYEQYIEIVFEFLRKGTLVLIDPNTGNHIQPKANHYQAECNRIIEEHLYPIVHSLKLMIYLDSKRRGDIPTVSPTEIGPIKWLADDTKLVELFQLLLRYSLINVKYADLFGIISGHFIDAYNQAYTYDYLKNYFDHPDSIEDNSITSKIHWQQTEAMLIYLIDRLIHWKIIQHKPDNYAYIIEKHFKNKKGANFKALQSQKVKVSDQYHFDTPFKKKSKKQQSDLELIDEIINRIITS